MSRSPAPAFRGPFAHVAAFCLIAAGSNTVLGASAAKAQVEPEIALTVRASPPGSLRCFDADGLRQRIAHYGEARLPRANELELELSVDALDSAELRVYRAGSVISRRRFERLPEACADRRDAVALAIALALDGIIRALGDAQPSSTESPESTNTTRSSAALAAAADARVAAPVATPPPAPERTTVEAEKRDADESQDEAEDEPASSEDSEPTRDTSPVHEARAWAPFVHLHLGVRGLVEGLPSPVWVGAFGAALWLTRQIAIDLSAIASTVGTSTLAGWQAETQLAGGELLGCGALEFGAFAAEGCAGASIAACRAGGEYPIPHPATTLLWAATTARLALRWPNDSWISLRIFVQGHVNLVRPELQVAGSPERLYPSWLGGSAGIDAVVSLE